MLPTKLYKQSLCSGCRPPCLEQQPLWQWCELSFRSYLLGELLFASLIRFLPTVSGPQSTRNPLCRPRFGSASPHLRPLATFSRPGSINHQRTPRATLANTLSGNFITNCNLSFVNFRSLASVQVFFRLRPVTELTCRSVKTNPDSSAHNLCKRLQTLQASKRQSVPSLFACSVFESRPTLGSCASSHPKIACALLLINLHPHCILLRTLNSLFNDRLLVPESTNKSNH